MIVTPLLTKAKALKGLDIRGRLEVCCGEMYFRMGHFDRLREVAQITTKFFDLIHPDKVTILCTAGYYMFKEVLPHFGGRYEFDFESYLELLNSLLQTGKLAFTQEIPLKASVQDSCYGKQFGNEYLEIPRNILKKVGIQIVEMEHQRERVLCCGIGAGFSPQSAYNPFAMAFSALRILREAQKKGAEALIVYCSGCLQMFSTAKALVPINMPVFHILEIIEIAMGGVPPRFSGKLGRTMLKGVIRNQFPYLLSSKRFLVPQIDDPFSEIPQ